MTKRRVCLKASTIGSTNIKQARKEKGWNLNDERWLRSASQVLGVRGSAELAPGISYGTWKRFLGGKKPVNEVAFKAYCQVLGLDWQKVVENRDRQLGNNHRDWGEAIDVSIFFGRTEESNTVRNWIIGDRCRSVLLLGMGGIGKTALSIKIARSVQSDFDFIIWRSLRNAPPLSGLLADIIQLISDRQETNLPESIAAKIDLLLKYLANARCLWVLDNVESVLDSGSNRDKPNGMASLRNYEQLFNSVITAEHQSCLLLTSREKPQAFTADISQARCLQLTGLQFDSAQDILSTKGLLNGSLAQQQQLSARYGGNPLALQIVASTIQDFFAGNIDDFLELSQSGFICEDIYLLLQQQCDRLNHLEKQIMYWLAINREPVLLTQLQSDLIEKISIETLRATLSDLKNRSLVETQDGKYTQQPVVMEYAIAEFIAAITEEMIHGKINLFNTHVLVKARAKDYIRDSQQVLILQPLIEQLTEIYGSQTIIQEQLTQILDRWRSHPRDGYLSGNIINLLRQLKLDLSGYNFSGMTVWQANLQNLPLHHVDFTNCDLSGSIFTEASGNILAVAFNPQGKTLATSDNGDKIRWWDKQTGQLLAIGSGHTNWIRCIAFAPDGRTLASGAADLSVRLWDSDTGRCLQTFRGHDDQIYSVYFSPDGEVLASGSSDRTIKLWSINTGKCLATYTGHDNWVRSVAFSPDGEVLASGSSDRTIKLWSINTGECLATYTGHDNWVRSVAFSPDGEVLASGSSDRTIKLWSINTGECLTTYTGHSGGVYAIAFSPDGEVLASGSADTTARLWDKASGKCCKTLYGHSNQLISLDFAPDGLTIACASLDRSVRLWDINTGKCLRSLRGYIDWAFPLAFATLGDRTPILVSAGSDQTIKLWNLDTGECYQTLAGHQGHIWSLAFSPNQGGILASCGAEQEIKLWNLNNGECYQVLLGHGDWVRSLCFSPDGKVLASASADGTVRLWDVTMGTAVIIPANQVWSIDFDRDGSILATGSVDGTVRLWDVTTNSCLQTCRAKNGQGVYSVAFSRDGLSPNGGKTFLSGSADGKSRLWDLQTGECLQTFVGHDGFIFAVAFSPDGKLAASGSCDRTIKLWNLKTGRCLQTFVGHADKVCSVAFSNNGKTIASGSQDQSVRLWDTATGQCMQVLRPKRLYESMNITGATGLTTAQQKTLPILGALGLN